MKAWRFMAWGALALALLCLWARPDAATALVASSAFAFYAWMESDEARHRERERRAIRKHELALKALQPASDVALKALADKQDELASRLTALELNRMGR